AGAITDRAGNPNRASNTLNINYTPPSGPSTLELTAQFTNDYEVTISENMPLLLTFPGVSGMNTPYLTCQVSDSQGNPTVGNFKRIGPNYTGTIINTRQLAAQAIERFALSCRADAG